MITKVSLTNWRSHLQSELEFSEGTNCLIGRMGSGKSSVLDAICFGLFGTFPQLQQKKIRLEDMIMKKPKDQRFAEVRIEFDSNGDGCSVKRRIEKGRSTSAEFRKNGKLVETQSQKVSEEVERILKVDYDLFTRAVYSEQNQLDMFLTIPKGQRMKRIDELLRLDRFELARVSAVSLENRFSFSREQKEKILEGMKEDEIKTESAVLKNDIDTLGKESGRLFSEAESAAKEKNLLKERIAKLEKAREEFYSLSQKLSSIESLNMQLSSDISVLEKHFSPIEGDAEELKRKIDVLKEKMNFVASEIKKMRERLLEKKIDIQAESSRLARAEEMKKEKEKIEALLSGGKLQNTSSELDAVSRELENGAVMIVSMKNEIKDCELALEGLSSADSKCLVCGHELSEEKKKELASESKKRMENLKAKIAEAEALMKKLSGEKNNLEKIILQLKIAEARKMEIGNPETETEKINQEIETLSNDISRAENELKNVEIRAASFQAEFENLVRKYESARNAALKRKEMEEKRKLLKGNIAEAENLKTGLIRVKESFSDLQLREVSEKMENIIGKEKSVEARLGSIKEIIIEKRKRLEEAESRKKMADGLMLEIRKASAMEQQLQLLQRGLEASQERLRKDFVGAINNAMHMIWENLYPYTDFSSVRMAVDGDYVLQLQDANGWTPIDNVSGGERSIACLALRIAFALVLAPQLRWLVLDEPTHNLDEKAVAELANVLHDSITEFVEQIFLITHDPSLEAAVSGYLYRMEKPKDGFTNVVKVEGE